MSVRLVLATRNAGKTHEIREILSGSTDARILSLDELGLEPTPDEDAVEAYDTFHENAVAKARFFARRTGLPTIADDAGLRVDALGGAPGVRTKRFALDAGRVPRPPEIPLDDLNNALLLERLAEVPAERRTAHFVCAAVLAWADRPVQAAVGTCSGRIGIAARGSHGFGYDPVFLVPELDRTFGELGAPEKNARSHRARAFRGLATVLRSQAGTA